jgi:YfiH family protein
MSDFLSSGLLADAGFRNAFTTRACGDFAILRDPGQQARARERLARAIGFDARAFFQTKQVHGREVVVAEGSPARFLDVEADAIIARAGSGHAVAARVADCVPIVVGDCASGRVAAIHAGWKGIEVKVIEAGVTALGADRKRFVAAIGPSIGPCCFETSDVVAERIARASVPEVIVRRVIGGPEDKAFVDLRRAARAQLVALGVSNEAIDDVPGCTRCDATRFESYRRDGDASGRMVGVIVAR